MPLGVDQKMVAKLQTKILLRRQEGCRLQDNIWAPALAVHPEMTLCGEAEDAEIHPAWLSPLAGGAEEGLVCCLLLHLTSGPVFPHWALAYLEAWSAHCLHCWIPSLAVQRLP